MPLRSPSSPRKGRAARGRGRRRRGETAWTMQRASPTAPAASGQRPPSAKAAAGACMPPRSPWSPRRRSRQGPTARGQGRLWHLRRRKGHTARGPNARRRRCEPRLDTTCLLIPHRELAPVRATGAYVQCTRSYNFLCHLSTMEGSQPDAAGPARPAPVRPCARAVRASASRGRRRSAA